MPRCVLDNSVGSLSADCRLQMFNKSIVPALSKQLDPLYAALMADLEGSKTSDNKQREVRKLLWAWIENIATLFWCLA